MGKGLDTAMRAVHEAGHAVAVLSLGYTVDAVRLEPPEVVCRFGPNAWRAELTVLCSGDAAVLRAGSRDRAWTDEADALQLINRIGAGSWELSLARGRAEELIDKEWARVERVAAALLNQRLLLGSQVRRVMFAGDADGASLMLLRLALAARAA